MNKPSASGLAEAANETAGARHPAAGRRDRDYKSETAKGHDSARPAPASTNGVMQSEPGATAGASMSAPDRSSVAARLAELATLDLPDLRQEWRQLFRREPPRLSRDQMLRTVAYRIQENAFGGLPQSVERRLAKLAGEFESEGRIAPLPTPKLKSGARLVANGTEERIPCASWTRASSMRAKPFPH